MAFRRANDTTPLRNVTSNSLDAKKFLESYNRTVELDAIKSDSNYTPTETFSPSSIRCKRMQWFRLRGTKPDVREPNIVLNFIAGVGTYCHEAIQSTIRNSPYFKYLDITEYLLTHKPPYKYRTKAKGNETLITVEDPPVKFACDGLVEFQGDIYLLEIKTCEASSLRSLVEPKPEHMDQIRCYCTLLDVRKAMILYQDRQYGHVKCFTYQLTESDRENILTTFEEVQDYVNRNIAPEALPKGDKWCNSSYCIYYSTCTKRGR